MTAQSKFALWRPSSGGAQYQDAEYKIAAWEGFAGLAAQREPWDSIMKEAQADPLCNAHEWSLAYAKAYIPESDVFGWTMFSRDGKPVAILPFRIEPSRGLLSLRRATFLGDGSFDSDYLDFPATPGHELAAAAAAVDLLSAFRRVDAAVLTCVSDASPTLNAIREIAKSRRLPRREIEVPCCVARLAPTFDEYIKSLKPRMRSKVRQALRQAADNGATWSWCDERESLAHHLENLYQLHAMRWAAAGHAGSFADHKRRHFYEIVAPTLLAAGRLRFARLEIAGIPVAYQIGAIAGNSYYQIQEGFHTDHAAIRVGTALRAHVIQALIEVGIQNYDFMAGESRHKEDWGAVHRPCTSIAFPLPRWRGRLAYGARAVADWWRARSAKQSPAATSDDRARDSA